MISKVSVRAAGGVVVRDGTQGRPEILLIHRPKYSDWSFPKGKLMDGETDEECALREVFEETGFICATHHELTSTSYVDRKGRPKVVRYWAMSLLGGSFSPNSEVDEILWTTLDEAGARLSYRHDRALLKEIAEATDG
jgi:8-oxo-dGTP diphosphatase